MMNKHGVRFDKAHEFDASALRRLPSVTIKPTLEYDAKKHTLQGPLLVTVHVDVIKAPRQRREAFVMRLS